MIMKEIFWQRLTFEPLLAKTKHQNLTKISYWDIERINSPNKNKNFLNPIQREEKDTGKKGGLRNTRFYLMRTHFLD